MPIYDLKCKACGRARNAEPWPTYEDADAEFVLEVPCPKCGGVVYVKGPPGLTADMSEQWEERCRIKHGVWQETPPVDPAERRREWDRKAGL